MGVAARKLVQYWRQQGLSPARGCHPDSIREFEVRNQVTLPPEMREYFLLAGGMKDTVESGQDDRGFSFWSISRVVAAEMAIDHYTPSLHHFDGDSSFFVFADYLNWSWAYAIRLSQNLGASNRVVIVGKNSPEIVAESFGQFVDLYVTDTDGLYEGTAVDSP